MREIDIIPSKSDAHRAYICEALSEEPCTIVCDGTSEDIEATKKCVKALKEGLREMDCGESGSTFRFFLPIMGALGRKTSFLLSGRLPQRPLSPLYEELIHHGCTLSEQGTVPFEISGQLRAGDYHLPGNVSSQYISGLLFALPLLKENSRIIIEGRLESSGYVDMTLKTLSRFGIEIEKNSEAGKSIFLVRGAQKYKGPQKYIVEGDWSNGAFWLAAGMFCEDGLRCNGLSHDSVQGDRVIEKLLSDYGAELKYSNESIRVLPGRLHGIRIDGSQIPDLVPVLALVAAVADGETVISNLQRLRLKESDRLESVANTLGLLGADIKIEEDSLIIQGKHKLRGGKVFGYNDHRIVMMAAIASLVCEKEVEIRGADAVKKSYPGFFRDLALLGLDERIIISKDK